MFLSADYTLSCLSVVVSSSLDSCLFCDTDFLKLSEMMSVLPLLASFQANNLMGRKSASAFID